MDFTTLVSQMPAGDIAPAIGYAGICSAMVGTWTGFQTRRQADVPGRFSIALFSFALISAPCLYLIFGQPSVLAAAGAVALLVYFVHRNYKITQQVQQLGLPDPD
jgi:hypothetical protein